MKSTLFNCAYLERFVFCVELKINKDSITKEKLIFEAWLFVCVLVGQQFRIIWRREPLSNKTENYFNWSL